MKPRRYKNASRNEKQKPRKKRGFHFGSYKPLYTGRFNKRCIKKIIMY